METESSHGNGKSHVRSYGQSHHYNDQIMKLVAVQGKKLSICVAKGEVGFNSIM